jgi:WXG100 family type VII secretion target
MNEIRVGFGAVQSVGENLKAEASKCEQHLNDTDENAAFIVNNWEGGASEGMQNSYKNWKVAAAELKDALHGLGGTTLDAVSSYQATEKAVGDLFQ